MNTLIILGAVAAAVIALVGAMVMDAMDGAYDDDDDDMDYEGEDGA